MFKDGYTSRTDQLLFATIVGDTMFFIQIFPHGSWYKSDLVEILHNNWPHLLKKYLYSGKAEYFNEIQKKNLRDKHTNAVISMKDGTTYFPPGGGTTASGLNIHDVIATDQIMATFKVIESDLLKNKEKVCATLKRDVSEDFLIKLDIDDELKFVPYDFEKKIGINFVLDS